MKQAVIAYAFTCSIMQMISKQDPEAEEKNSWSQDGITLRDLSIDRL